MDRGEKLRPAASNAAQWLDLRATQVRYPDTLGTGSRGELAVRSGLAWPRIPTMLDVGGIPSSPVGHVADYHDGADQAAQRWLGHGLV